jgi:hypothetical protein
MPYVLTADQIDSRTEGDRVERQLEDLADTATTLPFTRTVGDELQGLLESAVSVVDAILSLMRGSHWHIGLGIGPVEFPLPRTSRAARGPAFVMARTAVDAAKSAVSHLSVVATPPAEAEGRDVEAVLRLLAALRERRTPEGWAAVDLMATGHTQAQAAARLGVSRQAVGQRLAAAQWAVERDAIPMVERLLVRAESLTAAPTDPVPTVTGPRP